MIGELIMRCFHARTAAHVLHLKTRAYATHKALNDFYDAIVGLVDGLAEAWIGENGLIGEFPGRYTQPDDPVALIEGLADWIEANRETCGEQSHIQNSIDEIVALCRSTTYKLRFLK